MGQKMQAVPFIRALCLVAACWALAFPAAVLAEFDASSRPPNPRYEPTPDEVMDVMLRLAEIRPGDVVYDLGCGDGRIIIAAVRDLGASGVCVDIDAQRIAESIENARQAGVADRIQFRN